jgi:hypothetical protein
MAERCVTPSATARVDVDRLGLRVVRFEHLSSQHAQGLVGLSVRARVAWPDAARPSLIVQRGTDERLYPPRLVSSYRCAPGTCRRVCCTPHRDSGDWVWRALFTPPELASETGWIFQLRLNDDVVFRFRRRGSPRTTPAGRTPHGPAEEVAVRGSARRAGVHRHVPTRWRPPGQPPLRRPKPLDSAFWRRIHRRKPPSPPATTPDRTRPGRRPAVPGRRIVRRRDRTRSAAGA